MHPQGLKTKIFLDSGDPAETRRAIEILGFLDGQTTNPSLIAKNPDIQKRRAEGEVLTDDEVYSFYKGVVKEISSLIPRGSVSVEVYADHTTTTEEMLRQAREMYAWIPNTHIKFPTVAAGLEAAEIFVEEGGRVNMTLCFSQEQAVAVYSATRGAKKGDVFVSPFIGRLDDRGENGMDVIENILRMYREGDGHVEVLVASVRNYQHFLYALFLKADIITAPLKILEEWVGHDKEIPDAFVYKSAALAPIPYKKVDLDSDWHAYSISHPLTDAGVEKFAKDWNGLVGK